MPRLGLFLRAIIPTVLSVVPGWGHIWVRRHTRGLAIFLTFFAVANAAFLINQLGPQEMRTTAIRIALVICVGLWAFCFGDIIRIAVWLRSHTVQERRAGLFRKMVIHVLRGEHAQAEDSIRRMLRIDPYDVPALTYLGIVRRDLGRRDEAVRVLKKALRCRPDAVWTAEIEHEIRLVQGGTA